MPRKHGGYESVHDAILAAAATLFIHNGIHGTSLNDIASEAKLSKGTLYYYYPAKETLVMDICARNSASMTEAMFSWVDSLSRECDVYGAIDALICSIAENEPLSKLYIALFTEAMLGNAQLRDSLDTSLKEWTVMLEVGTLKIQSRDAVILRARSKLFFTLLTGYMLQRHSGLSTLSTKELSELIMAH